MKIAIFGSGGMAGHMVARYLAEQYGSITRVARSQADLICDFEDTEQVKATLHKLVEYDWIINCVGLLVKDSMDRPDRAAIVNGWLPHYIEWWAKDSKTRIIHLSTDCVFDGSIGHYKENDPHTELNAYGRSKSLGEINNSKDVTFRTSIIGPEIKSNGTGLLHWFTIKSDRSVGGYVDAWWNGITTLQLAKCIVQHINNPIVTGVCHLVNNDNFINKFELLQLINEVYLLDKIVKKTTGPKVVNKILVDSKLKVDWSIPDYRTQLRELLDYTQ